MHICIIGDGVAGLMAANIGQHGEEEQEPPEESDEEEISDEDLAAAMA